MAPFSQAKSLWCRLSARAQYFTKGIALMTAACALVVAVGPAWLALGLPVFATHYHVVTHVAGEIGKVEKKVEEVSMIARRTDSRAIAGQIETVEVRRSLVDKEIFELDLVLGRSGSPMDDQVRGTLALRKRALEDDRRNLDYRLDQLQRADSGRRP